MSGPSRDVVLALGSNMGDRLGHLQSAVDGLAATPGAGGQPGVAVRAVSAVYETDPVGGPEQPDFLNAVVLVRTALDAEVLMRRALELEKLAGRERRERWGPRTLDVDLIRCGEERRQGPFLTLPHPRAALRAFVLLPWRDVEPDGRLPGGGLDELIAALPPADVAGVRRRPDLALLA